MNARLAEALEHCTKAIVLTNQRETFPIVAALTTCQHGHHFAVVNSGMSVIVAVGAIDCLRDQGVNV